MRMRYSLYDQEMIQRNTSLFLDIFKWIVYASCIGGVVGASTFIFIKSLEWSIAFAGGFPYYFLLLPFAMVACTVLVRKMAPQARGHGTEQVIEAVHQRFGKIDHMVVPVKAAATILTIALGGSAGKEGPAAQIGAGLSSLIADIFKLKDADRKKLVICGISAGFSAVFGTPIAGAIFGIEVIYVGSLMYELLLASFIAGIISFYVASLLGLTYSFHSVTIIPDFSETFFLQVIAGAIFFGFCARLLIEGMGYAGRLSGRLQVPYWAKPAIGGTVLVALALLVSPQYLGLGTGLVEQAVSGAPGDWYAFLAKIAYTSVTLGFGGSGGIVTPIFVIGSTAGALYAQIMGANVATFAAIGLVSLLAGATKTPIASSIMAIELFGPQIGPYAAVACIISFIITGSTSVFPSQVFLLKRFI